MMCPLDMIYARKPKHDPVRAMKWRRTLRRRARRKKRAEMKGEQL